MASDVSQEVQHDQMLRHKNQTLVIEVCQKRTIGENERPRYALIFRFLRQFQGILPGLHEVIVSLLRDDQKAAQLQA